MGWIFEDEQGTLWLSRNLEVADQVYPIPTGWNSKFSQKTETLNGIATEMIYLSPYCTWKFVNINEAFRNILGSPSRTLLIYSDVAESTKVGDQVVDLLREVEYKREDKATVYFEPMHIQYLPVRNEYIEIIQTQVSETNGNLANLQGGHTLLTLHFKKQ